MKQRCSYEPSHPAANIFVNESSAMHLDGLYKDATRFTGQFLPHDYTLSNQLKNKYYDQGQWAFAKREVPSIKYFEHNYIQVPEVKNSWPPQQREQKLTVPIACPCQAMKAREKTFYRRSEQYKEQLQQQQLLLVEEAKRKRRNDINNMATMIKKDYVVKQVKHVQSEVCPTKNPSMPSFQIGGVTFRDQ